jgi:hypothetical protein
MAPPAQPHVEIEAARIIRKLTEHSRVDRYRMGLNLLPECLAEADHIPVRLRMGEVLISRSTAPDPLTVPNGMLPSGRVGPEVDGAGEDPLEPSTSLR